MFKERQLLHLALLRDIDDVFILYDNRELEILADDTARLCACSIKIYSSQITLNVFSEQDSLSVFRFRNAEMGTVADFFGWISCRKIRNRYRCGVIIATCIVLRRLASLRRWRDAELYTRVLPQEGLSGGFGEVRRAMRPFI